ncbi:MAG: CCA tRNA nucleotidyltransferase [Spirochaetes bacterium]|nr:CCA tRNA nucleotidyltransferase [Spirochaetota bacterium]MBU0954603.1 CCA tRNA nucleotidyltransferase [Spirochaetota bacterium]
MKIFVPRPLRDFAQVFYSAGYTCYFVGGAVRDSILGKKAADWDAATDARPEQVQQLFRKVIPTGVQHGTVSVRWHDALIETTTFRIDGDYQDGRRPQTVQFSDDLIADLSRRDFTINGMAVDPRDGKLIDPFGGLADLKAGVVRAIGDPLERFGEDGLRPLRAVRFATRFAFEIDPTTLAAIPQCLDRFRMVSAERIREEFSKTLICSGPSYGLGLLESCGLLAEFLPELAICRGISQGDYHAFDVFDHSRYACDAAPAVLELRLAALLHDIGKPTCRTVGDDGAIHFYGHELESARLAEKLLRRLKYPNQLVDSVTHLIRQHMFDYSPEWTDAAVRRFAARVGLDKLPDLIQLRLADAAGMKRQPTDARLLLELQDRVAELRARENAFSVKDLAINGNDLSASGWPKGPKMGQVLQELLETVLDDPELNTPERLQEIASRLKIKYGIG